MKKSLLVCLLIGALSPFLHAQKVALSLDAGRMFYIPEVRIAAEVEQDFYALGLSVGVRNSLSKGMFSRLEDTDPEEIGFNPYSTLTVLPHGRIHLETARWEKMEYIAQTQLGIRYASLNQLPVEIPGADPWGSGAQTLETDGTQLAIHLGVMHGYRIHFTERIFAEGLVGFGVDFLQEAEYSNSEVQSYYGDSSSSLN